MSRVTLFFTFCVTFPEKFKQKYFQITNNWKITNFIKKQYFEEKIKKSFPRYLGFNLSRPIAHTPLTTVGLIPFIFTQQLDWLANQRLEFF